MMRQSVVLLALLCAGGAALAQIPPSDAHTDGQAKRQQWEQKWQQERARMEQKRLDRMAVLLDMTPAQKQQAQAIFASEHTRMQQAIRQAMETRRAAHAETLTKLGQVLSPTQMKKLELLMPERHHRFPMMCGRMGHMGHMGEHGGMGMWGSHPDHGMGPPPPPGPGPQ